MIVMPYNEAEHCWYRYKKGDPTSNIPGPDRRYCVLRVRYLYLLGTYDIEYAIWGRLAAISQEEWDAVMLPAITADLELDWQYVPHYNAPSLNRTGISGLIEIESRRIII